MIEELIVRDEFGRFGLGNSAATLRKGSKLKITHTMRADALRELAAAGREGNPLLGMWDLARNPSTHERTRAWLYAALCKQLWGEKMELTGEDGAALSANVDMVRALAKLPGMRRMMEQVQALAVEIVETTSEEIPIPEPAESRRISDAFSYVPGAAEPTQRVEELPSSFR